MVATTLVKVKSITADLPAGEKSTQAKSEKTPIINLRGGEMFFSDKRVKIAELNERLAALDLPNQDGENASSCWRLPKAPRTKTISKHSLPLAPTAAWLLSSKMNNP
jgi:hypothetical protein